MKIFAFFMAFYILTLSIVPCSDVHNDCGDEKAKTELTQNHDHQQDQDDNCTPFCTCACCNVSVVAMDFATQQIEVATSYFVAKKVAIHNFLIRSSILENIWQPPKFI